MTVELKTAGLDELRRRLGRVRSARVKFGSMGPAGSPSGPHPNAPGFTVAGLLRLHEFGLGGMPERSVVRAVANGKRTELASVLKAAAAVALDMRSSPRDLNPLIGEPAARMLIERHSSLGTVSLRDGTSRPALYDSGAIRDSLGWAKDDST